MGRDMNSKTANPHPRVGPNSQAESFKSLDGRGIVARRMKAIRHELAEALGGADALSPQQKILIDCIAVRAIRTKMLTAQMLGGDGLSAEAERRLNWHLASIRRDLVALGLEKRAAQQPRLAEILGQGKAA